MQRHVRVAQRELAPYGGGMVSMSARYDGELHCSARHGPSDSTLSTDAPKDNHGRGEAFSPTDLVGAALATCALTTMAIAVRNQDIDLSGATAQVEKGMVADPRRRIGSLPLQITIPGRYSAEQKAVLEKAARTCPVASSLHPDLQANVSFVYPDE